MKCLNKANKFLKFQKHQPEVSCKKSCSKKFRNIHRKIIVLKSLFNKIAELQVCDSNTGVFLWILRNFWEHLRTAASMLSTFLLNNLKPVFSRVALHLSKTTNPARSKSYLNIQIFQPNLDKIWCKITCLRTYEHFSTWLWSQNFAKKV